MHLLLQCTCLDLKNDKLSIKIIVEQKLIITVWIVQMSKPIFQEYKNALHMSKINPNISDNMLSQVQHQRSTKTPEKEGKAPQFGLSTFSRNFKNIEKKESKFKQCMEGIGITIDDTGHLIIGQWKNNQIDGKYFLFKPNIFQQNGQNNALCQYGSMKNGQLHGDNYIYNNLGTLAKAEFSTNNLQGKSYIIHNNKLFIANQSNETNTIECQVIHPSNEFTKNTQFKVPHLNSISTANNKLTPNYQKVSANLFIKPNQFIENLVRQNQQKGNSQEILVCININQRESFIGFLQVDNKKQKVKCVNRIKRDKINGFGAIFKNQWPVSYGKYKSGQLQGLGRVYQTEKKIFDGYFANGQLIEGFIIDYYAKTVSFGHHSSIDPEFQAKEQGYFIVTNTFQIVSLDCIIQYRRNFHLKSLNFNSSYFNPPKLLHRSPWPYNIMDKLNKKTHIESIIKQFRPTLRDIQLSFIEKVNQNSDNRVERQLVDEIKESFSFKQGSDKAKTEMKPYFKNQLDFKIEEQQPKAVKKEERTQLKKKQPQIRVIRKHDENPHTKLKQINNNNEDYGHQNIVINKQIQQIQSVDVFKNARKSYVREFKKERINTYSRQLPYNKQPSVNKIQPNRQQMRDNKRHIGSIKSINAQSSIKHSQSNMKAQGIVKAEGKGKIQRTNKAQSPIKPPQSPVKHLESSIKHGESSSSKQGYSWPFKQGESSAKQSQNSKRQLQISIKQQQTSKRHTQSSIKDKTYSNTPSVYQYEDRMRNTRNNLTDLVNQYHQCQTQRKKSISGNTTKRNNDISPRSIMTTRRQSARQGYTWKGKYPTHRRKVDLDLVYGDQLQR